MANEQFGGDTGAPVQAVLDGVHALYRNVRHLVIVTNEVFYRRHAGLTLPCRHTCKIWETSTVPSGRRQTLWQNAVPVCR